MQFVLCLFYSLFNVSLKTDCEFYVWISPFIKTAKTHDYFNVLLLSFPEIKIIYFNEKRDQAIIYFYISYAMGETIYEKVNNKWNFKSSKIINVY